MPIFFEPLDLYIFKLMVVINFSFFFFYPLFIYSFPNLPCNLSDSFFSLNAQVLSHPTLIFSLTVIMNASFQSLKIFASKSIAHLSSSLSKSRKRSLEYPFVSQQWQPIREPRADDECWRYVKAVEEVLECGVGRWTTMDQKNKTDHVCAANLTVVQPCCDGQKMNNFDYIAAIS